MSFSTQNQSSNQAGQNQLKSLKLKQQKLPFNQDEEYDVIVIGGGSGGISFASQARSLGLSVALFDYVQPSIHGSTWGLGGTCVNVGCIPKKLFHIGAQLKDSTYQYQDFGWKNQLQQIKLEHDWNILRNNVQQYIKAINFGYKSRFSEIGVHYINAFAQFENKEQVSFTYKQGDQEKKYHLKGKNFVIATGNRPRNYPGIPELAQYAITSDDLFSLKEDPGKTLVIGGGYIAIECAGFLNGLGKEVIIINRSSFLRSMDQDMAFRIVDEMRSHGVQALEQTVPLSVKKLEDKLFEVQIKTGDKVQSIQVNTILVAIGRDAQPDKLKLQNAGILLSKSKKVQGRKNEIERSNIDHIYAIGDVLEGVPELQPVASKSGKILANRVFERLKTEKSDDEILVKYSTDYNLIPTTVFSPTEYSFVGLNEEEAIKKFGDDNVEIYHREVTPLQFSIVQNNQKTAYMKLICLKNEENKVIGLHYFGPSADEVISGYALAMKLGLNKDLLDQSFGIHPSTSEDLFTLEVTKRSGESYSKTEC